IYLGLFLFFRFFALSSFRPFFLICMGLAVTLCGKMWYSRTWCEIKCEDWYSAPSVIFDRQKADHPGTPSVSGLSHDIAEVCVRASCFARSLLVYRRQNPGQFCFLACCFFTFLAMLGHCIPGLVLSYSTVLLVLFCPLVMNHGVWHQLSLPFELVLQWMDFSHHAYMKSKPKECTDPSSSSSASMDAPSTAFFSCLDAGSLSTIQPHPTAGTSRECHSSVSTSQRHPQQPSFEPENEGEDFEMLDQLELNLMDPLEQKQQ
ncbi:protein FAM134C-like, partial [Arapaima gigas]